MLAREAAFRGIRTALLEKADFGCGITSRSTRLIHGGLRYLEGFHVRLVRESLADRERLLREFPGQVTPLPFVLPSYSGDSRPSWYLGLGLMLYRTLARGGSLPPHRRLDVQETLSLLPGLDPRGLLGGFEFYDCQAAYPERLALEMALQAAEAGADVSNHARVTSFLEKRTCVTGVRYETSGGTRECSARLVVNAAGAWVDTVLGSLERRPSRRLLKLVNGAHVVVSGFAGAPRHAIYREAHSDGRPFFIVPWLGLHLIGTTETPCEGDPALASPSRDEVLYLLHETKRLFPEARIGPDTVLYAYSGPRPLLHAKSVSLNRMSRGHRVIDHEETDGIGGLLTMAGGKLTTAPSFARQAIRRIEAKLGLPATRPRPVPLPNGNENVPSRIATLYGPRSLELLHYLRQRADLCRPVADGCETTVGEILFAVECEKACTLGDVVLRRTGMAFDPSFSREWLKKAVEVCSRALGWDASIAEEAVRTCETEVSQTLRSCTGIGTQSATMA